jgi:hypothetical protein
MAKKPVSRKTPEEIAQEMVDASGLSGAQGKRVHRAALRAIRAEREGSVHLTRAEAAAAKEAISQMTFGNGHDFKEWKLSTHGTKAEWDALLSAEKKLIAHAKGKEPE